MAELIKHKIIQWVKGWISSQGDFAIKFKKFKPNSAIRIGYTLLATHYFLNLDKKLTIESLPL
jgi:hypothetical protein